MGTWIGHIAPGVFFVILAFWWHLNNCIRYIRSLKSQKNPHNPNERYEFKGSVTYPCCCCCFPTKTRNVCRRLPIESIIKILITSIHFTIEIITGYHSTPRPHLEEENSHHTAMLFGFFLGAWIEILVHYKAPLPKRITQVMGFLAFAIEALMMVFHLHARSMMDAHIHQLLGLTIICSMISALGECYDPDQFWFIVARSFFALIQGTWFLQAAFVIWPQTTNPYFLWDPDSHRSISLLTMSYAYHMAGNAFLLILVYLAVALTLSASNKDIDDENDDSTLDYKLITSINDDDNTV